MITHKNIYTCNELRLFPGTDKNLKKENDSEASAAFAVRKVKPP